MDVEVAELQRDAGVRKCAVWVSVSFPSVQYITFML